MVKTATSYISDNGAVITSKPSVRDLGVTMSSDGSFTEHIASTVQQSKQKCGWILRSFKSRDGAVLMPLFKSLVQCKLDYCSQLWSPMKKGEIQSIEMVQRSFIRKVQHMNYWAQLKHLGLYSQERRRERYRIIYIWRILEGHSPNVNGCIKPKWIPRRGRVCELSLIHI